MRRVGIVLLIAMLAFLLVFVSVSAFGQKPTAKLYPEDKISTERSRVTERYESPRATKKPGHYTREDWQEAIDETWWWGRSKSQKLYVFNTFWDNIDEEFAAFVDHLISDIYNSRLATIRIP